MSKGAFAVGIRRALLPVMSALLIWAVAGCSQSNDPNAWYDKTIVENLGGHTTPSPDARGQPVAPRSPVDGADSSGVALQGGDGVAPPGGPAVAVAPPGEPVNAAGPAAPSALYSSEISCGALPSPPPAGTVAAATGYAAPADISLQMTECDVARRVGRPDKVELSSTPDGQRALTLAYLRGPQPRLYHFVAGRLMSIEYIPPPPTPRNRRVSRLERAM